VGNFRNPFIEKNITDKGLQQSGYYETRRNKVSHYQRRTRALSQTISSSIADYPIEKVSTE
jgi:hypothetical protein